MQPRTTSEPDAPPTTREHDAGADAQPLRGKPVPLIDLASVDLNATSISKKQIEDYIPHRGEMAQLDRVIWHKADFTAALAVKRIRNDEFWCEGHIPGRPILPGVLMIEAGAQLASIMYFARMDHRKFAGFTRIENTAFRGIVQPGDDLYLIANEVKFHVKRFISDVQGVVNGRVIFESRITGMILG